MKDFKHLNDLADLDYFREMRTGIPEVVYAQGKTYEDVVKIMTALLERTGHAMATRLPPDYLEQISSERFPGAELTVHQRARIAVASNTDYQPRTGGGRVGILTAGTSDIPVAEEARVILQEMGCEVVYRYDVGVAGIHRVLDPLKEMVQNKVSALIVIAGMDGILPTIVRGLVDLPVIGVPTSTGYGYGGGGTAALMTMLQSCSPGITVVNIDNGFGAAVAARLIAASPR